MSTKKKSVALETIFGRRKEAVTNRSRSFTVFFIGQFRTMKRNFCHLGGINAIPLTCMEVETNKLFTEKGKIKEKKNLSCIYHTQKKNWTSGACFDLRTL